MAEINFSNNAIGKTQGTQFDSGLRQNSIQPGGLKDNRIQETAQKENNAQNNPLQPQTQNAGNADLIEGSAQGGNIERRAQLTGQNNPLVENGNSNPQVDLKTERSGENALSRTEQNAMLDSQAAGAGQAPISRENPVERGVQRTEEKQLQNIDGNNARIANQAPKNVIAAPGISEENQLGNKVDVLA
ncbi:MAG: hypothetical protein GY863_15175 [bacterium]|nr:hypothetical protein [bacterium]